MTPRARAAALVLGAGLLAGPAQAQEWSGEGWEARFSGSLRSLYTYTERTDAELFAASLFLGGPPITRRDAEGLLLERLRLELEASVGDHWTGVIEYDHEAWAGTGVGSLEFQVGKELPSETWVDADHVIHDGERSFWRHRLYRAWLRYEGEALELTLGRQRIALGRGRLWNPTDLFNPIAPLAIEPGERIGQDAGVLRARLSDGLTLMGIWSPQDDPDRHRASARLEWSTSALDAAGMVARIGRDWVFGADFATNLGDAALRGEATYTDLAHREDPLSGLRTPSGLLGDSHPGSVLQWVVSVDYTFSVGSGLYVLVEHFANDAVVSPGLAELLARPEELGTSRLVTVARHQTGIQTSYELSPLWTLGVLWIHDWNGASNALAPTLTWSPRDDLEVTFAAQLFSGDGDHSQFGSAAPLWLARADFFF